MSEFNLKLAPTEEKITCVGQDKCSTCRIGPNGSGYCGGCKGHCGRNGPSVMASCNRECMTCGGGPAAPNTVPAICCKSPVADLALDKVERDSYAWTKRPQIKLDTRGIVVTQGSIGGRVTDPYPKETKAIAVNLRHVWSTRGWYSHDMRDYLKIPKGVKLILLTMTHDDVLERAWDRKLYDEDCGKIGFDYWQPLSFSLYEQDAKMNMYWQFRRTLLATERSKAWFAPEIPWLMTRKIDSFVTDCAAAIPQIMMNAQFVRSDEEMFAFLKVTLRLHNTVPKSVAFWFVGMGNRRYIKAMKSFFRPRDCYFLSVAPWLIGHKGKEFTSAGKVELSRLPKEELVVQNQRTFIQMVEDA